MSDRELREIVKEVIAGIDSGRIRVGRPRFRKLKALLAPPVFAAALGAAAMGCGRAVGIAGDGGVGQDGSVEPDAAAETYDAEPEEPDAEVFPDGGPVLMYGEPFPEFPEPDAGVEDGGQMEELDAGNISLYSVPFSGFEEEPND